MTNKEKLKEVAELLYERLLGKGDKMSACFWHEEFQDMNATCKFCNCSETDYDYDPVCEDCEYYIDKEDVVKMVKEFQRRVKND